MVFGIIAPEHEDGTWKLLTFIIRSKQSDKICLFKGSSIATARKVLLLKNGPTSHANMSVYFLKARYTSYAKILLSMQKNNLHSCYLIT